MRLFALLALALLPLDPALASPELKASYTKDTALPELAQRHPKPAPFTQLSGVPTDWAQFRGTTQDSLTADMCKSMRADPAANALMLILPKTLCAEG